MANKHATFFFLQPTAVAAAVADERTAGRVAACVAIVARVCGGDGRGGSVCVCVCLLSLSKNKQHLSSARSSNWSVWLYMAVVMRAEEKKREEREKSAGGGKKQSSDGKSGLCPEKEIL